MRPYYPGSSQQGWLGRSGECRPSLMDLRALGFHHTAGLDTACAHPHSFCLTILNASQLL